MLRVHDNSKMRACSSGGNFSNSVLVMGTFNDMVLRKEGGERGGENKRGQSHETTRAGGAGEVFLAAVRDTADELQCNQVHMQ